MNSTETFFYWAGVVLCAGTLLGVIAVVWAWAIDRLFTMLNIKWMFLKWVADYYAKRRADRRHQERREARPGG